MSGYAGAVAALVGMLTGGLPGGGARAAEPDGVAAGDGAVVLSGAPSGHTLAVSVTAVGPHGAALGADGAEVALALWTTPPPMRGGDPTVDAAWTARTGPSGQARFADLPDPGAGQTYVATVRYRGITWPVGDLVSLDRPLSMIVYEPGGDRAALHMNLHLIVQPSEGALLVQEQVRVANPTLTAIDVDDAAGLRLPLLTPLVFGAPVDPGLVPVRPDPDQFQSGRTPALGRLVPEGGALVYRGPVPPGDELTLTVSYRLPYDDALDHCTLGLRAPVDLDRVLVETVHPDLIAPRIAPRADFVAVSRVAGDGHERFMTLTHPPRAGETLIIDATHLPTRRPLNAAVALWGALAMVLVFALGLLRGQRRARALAARAQASLSGPAPPPPPPPLPAAPAAERA